ncbi:amidase [Reyranella sp. CPCC 100927]|uniref:amidase n=1 Tax=Reyranella sp. CPCC 100927 TaxID=2599616 RepID=UPI0011B563B1|nr:amidase [Reyranella sp. CPCC 100927]TWT11356.1 amidase [Reyranella sp. CPCC 100927]
MDAPPDWVNRRAFLAGAAATVAWTGGISRAFAQAPPVDAAYRSARDLVADLAARKVSAVDLLDQAIARIEALDKRINAVVVRDFERARQAAQAADQALARGERRPLLGLPMTVKEAYNVAGLPTTWGIPTFKDWRPPEDALVVQRLKAAGAVIMGKTNVPVALADWQSTNPIYGTTNNPYDVSRTPGGSSGGSAAALAAGYVALEAGSDIGGSLRAPAHYCGVFAHKPTYGIVPQRGHTFPGAPAIPTAGDGLSVCGPMARTAADVTLGLQVMAGPDELRDGVGWKLALPPPRHEALRDFKVLVIDTHPLCPTSTAVRDSIAGLADRLGKDGVSVARESTLLPDLAAATRTYMHLLAPILSQGQPPAFYERMRTLAAQMGPDDQSLDAIYVRGANAAWRDVATAGRQRAVQQRQWAALFKQVDVVLCPVMPTVAYPHDHNQGAARRLDVDGQSQSYTNNIVWAGLALAGGLPASVAPIDRTPAGLPIGVQILGPFLEDHTTLRFAQLLEQTFGGFVPPKL